MSFDREEENDVMENYDTLLKLARIDEEDDHYSFVEALVWLLETSGYLTRPIEPSDQYDEVLS